MRAYRETDILSQLVGPDGYAFDYHKLDGDLPANHSMDGVGFHYLGTEPNGEPDLGVSLLFDRAKFEGVVRIDGETKEGVIEFPLFQAGLKIKQ